MITFSEVKLSHIKSHAYYRIHIRQTITLFDARTRTNYFVLEILIRWRKDTMTFMYDKFSEIVLHAQNHNKIS